MLRIAICEDNGDDAKKLADEISGYAEMNGVEGLHFSFFKSGEAFLKSDEMFDIVFMDIYMGGITGLKTIEKFRQKAPVCPVIFTTTSSEHALEAYALEAEQYLVKPIMADKIKRILQKQMKKTEPSLTVVFNRKNIAVPFTDIMYLEIKGRAVIIHTKDREYTIWNTKLAELKTQLVCGNSPFIQCHKSFIVNLEFIKNLDDDFILTNGERVYITRTRTAELRREWQRYIMRKTEGKFAWQV
jgi:DNA-binding LytR/AlgR family response regulator